MKENLGFFLLIHCIFPYYYNFLFGLPYVHYCLEGIQGFVVGYGIYFTSEKKLISKYKIWIFLFIAFFTPPPPV